MRQNPAIEKFMQRVTFQQIINYEDFLRRKREDPDTFYMKIEIKAKGSVYKKEMPHRKGLWKPVE